MTALVKNFFENYPIRHICFTGGEPLLFKEQINLILRIIYEKLHYKEFDIKIETSGLINFPYIYPYNRRLIYTITPKFKYINDYSPDNFNISCNDIIFKFMMELDEHKFSEQLDQLILFLTNNNLHGYDFYFAPINRDNNILENYKQLVRNMNNYSNHLLFKSGYTRDFKGITIQLNKLLEWK